MHLKKVIWLLQFTAAVGAGMLWRLIRRAARRPPRIWHGHRPVHMTRDMVRADRLAGFPSRSVATSADVLRYGLMTARDFDRVLSLENAPPDTMHWRAMTDLHLRGDVWVAYFDCHFFPVSQRRRNDLALRVVRLAGIRIVVVPHGSDVVALRPEKTRYDWIGRMQLDYPTWDFREQTSISRSRIELFDRYASLVIAADPPTAALMGRVDLVFKYFPVDIPPGASVEVRDIQRPLIVHAPNHRHVKGTDFLLGAIARVQAAGLGCELELVERVPRDEAIEMYRRADIIADQFCIGAFGVFALEALALGKPVLAYLDEEHLANSALNLPLVNAPPERIAEVLAVLIALPELRARLGAAGRNAVERYHSYAAIGEVWSAIYRHLWRGEALALESTVHFEPGRTRRSLSEDPGDASFWPVAVNDLMPEIERALTLLRQR